MRKLVLLTFLAVVVALPLQARGRNESYISYDDGGTIVRQGDDNREIDARVNLPVFPGDEVITNRRGRAEVRLADGNVVGIDRATAIRFKSVLDSYDSESNDTLAELRYGKVAIYRSDDARESLRLDTQSASYFAGQRAVFSVEADARGQDRVSVFDGTIEVRTPSRTTRVRAGESASVDDRGLYDLVNDDHYSADDFERWFLKRADRYGNTNNSRYLDRSLSYYDDDLSRNGSWTFISGFGYGWRPYVSTGWRPYFYGQWSYSRAGCLTWVSYEPWGWVPYHYGRWAYDAFYGWFWMPGAAYAPAWVYWWYSPGYIGWAPAGWYDCYRPYYDWAYRPYARAGIDFGFGFYGRVRVHEVDLRPWTFLDANTIVSNRVDRAAVSTDIVRARLIREPGGGFATVSGTPARFGGGDRRDPAGAVNAIYRRGLGGGNGGSGQSGSPTDMTPFFRRDSDIGNIRDRIVRNRPVEGGGQTTSRGSGGSLAPIGGGSVAPIGGGNVAPIGSGNLAPIGRGSVAPIGGGDGRIRRDEGGGTNRGTQAPAPAAPQTPTPRDNGGRINRGGDTPVNRDVSTPEPAWRSRISRAFPGGIETGDRPQTSSPTPPSAPRDENWRGRVTRDEPGSPDATPTPRTQRPRSIDHDRGSDVPRRVIDGIGGARIYRGDGDRSSGRSSAPPPPRAPEARPPARESSPPPQHHDSGGSKDSGASRGEGGRVHRDKGD
ncbi:MAG TPA: DUF6600 domain-containing protein [Thermoanaerobaculia bacterium]